MNRPKFEKRELYTMLLILFAALLICYILLIALGELPMPIIGDLDAQQTPTEQPTNQPTDEPDPQTTDFSTPYFTPSVILQPSNDPSKLLQVYFIDVGQGDCAILISPNGETMLIDGGELGNYDTISGYLDELDIDDIDVMLRTDLSAIRELIRLCEICSIQTMLHVKCGQVFEYRNFKMRTAEIF